MRPRAARFLVRLYPRPWRERYGGELAALLESEPLGPRAIANILRSALGEHVLPTRGLVMQQDSRSLLVFLRQPSAFLPLLISLAALAVVLGHVAAYGIIREADEGAAAHIWQILTALELPLVLVFAFRWWTRARRQTLLVLALLAATTAANCAAVYFLT
jgi:hypothetical protein